MFLRNAWYVAAWATEIGRQNLLRRTLLNEPVVFYRTEDGTPVALATFSLIDLIVGSDSQNGTLHQLVFEVRTGDTPSPASERSKWCPPFSSSARIS